MQEKKEQFLDYEPVTRGRARADTSVFTSSEDFLTEQFERSRDLPQEERERPPEAPAAAPSFRERYSNWMVRRGHTVSFIGVFLFTLAVYFRPYELIPALQPLSTMAFWIAVTTILVYLPTQLGLEGKLTWPVREVKLVLLLSLAVLLSVPLADDRLISWYGFVDFFKVVLIFIVMVNVIRTENRWKLLLVLLLAISCFLGARAFWDYQAGILLIEGRVAGSIGNMFQNPNDLALHLVTMVPISVGLMLSTRNPVMKLFYVCCAVVMLAGIAVTLSRGGLVGLVFAVGVLVWKLMRRHRVVVLGATLVLLATFVMLAPGGLASRFSGVFDQDQFSSAAARKDDLKRSILVTLRHPIFGIGIGNFALRSNRALATHNSYTQVSAEVGIAAMVLYIMFLITPLKRLRGIERETLSDRKKSRFHYLAVGMQASLVGYMVCSFFASVAFLWYAYYLVALSVCLSRLYQAEQLSLNGALKQVPGLSVAAKEPQMAVS